MKHQYMLALLTWSGEEIASLSAEKSLKFEKSLKKIKFETRQKGRRSVCKEVLD